MRKREKPYTVYTVASGGGKVRWGKILGIAAVSLVVLFALACGGLYLWLHAHVVGPNSGPEQDAVREYLDSRPASQAGLDSVPDPPGTKDIVLFGSDNRDEGQGLEEHGRSDTMMLVHIDSARNFVSVLSLPRDLLVDIPGYGEDKLNAAYSFGGPQKAIETIEQLTGVRIDDYVDIDFDAFREVTEALGGVWIDVDRHYYWNNDQGWSSEYHENLNIEAGYQRLRGEDALDFVRFRVDENGDFGRMQRQQLFLREARSQLISFGTALKIPQLAGLLSSNIKTSLDTNEIISLAWFGLHLDGSRISSLTLESDSESINGIWYVIAPSSLIRSKVEEMMAAPEERSLPDGTSYAKAVSPQPTGAEADGTEPIGGEATVGGALEGYDPIKALAANGIVYGEEYAALQEQVGFQLQGPSYVPAGYRYLDRRVYEIQAEGGTTYPAVKTVYQLEDQDQYLGIMQTTFLEAPLAAAGEKIEGQGVTFTLVGMAGNVDHVWWKKDGVLYWVSNTLSHLLTREQLLQVAENMIAVK